MLQAQDLLAHSYRRSLLRPLLKPPDCRPSLELAYQLSKHLSLVRTEDDLLLKLRKGLELPLPHVLSQTVCKVF